MDPCSGCRFVLSILDNRLLDCVQGQACNVFTHFCPLCNGCGIHFAFLFSWTYWMSEPLVCSSVPPIQCHLQTCHVPTNIEMLQCSERMSSFRLFNCLPLTSLSREFLKRSEQMKNQADLIISCWFQFCDFLSLVQSLDSPCWGTIGFWEY